MSSKKASSKRGNKEFSFSFILSVLSAFFGALFSFLAAKFLEAETYGEIQYYISIVTLLSSFMLFGVDSFLIKNAQFENNQQQLLSKSIVFVFAISTLILPIYVGIGYTFLSRLHQESDLIFFIFVIAFLLSLSSLGGAFLQSKSKYHLRLFLTSFIPHALFLAIFGIHYLTGTLDSFIKFYLLYYCLIYGTFGIVVTIKYLFPLADFFSSSQIKGIIFFGLTWVLYNITTPLSTIFIGEKYDDLGIAGIFSISNQLLTISGLATGIISQISNTTFAKYAKQNDIEKLFLNYERITRINMYIAVPFFAAFIIEAQNIMNFFGDSYLGHNAILILLTVSALIECVTGPCGTILLMGGKEKENFIASIVKFITFMIVLLSLIRFTELAAPIGLAVSSIISNAIKLIILRVSFKKNFFSLKILLTFAVLFSISSATFFGLSFIQNTLIWAVSNAFCGVALIIGFILLTPFKDDKKYFSKGKEI